MKSETLVMIFAIVAALGLVGAVTIETLVVQQEVDARGCKNSVAANASQGRCIH